jgi:Uma2 family endonuclease
MKTTERLYLLLREAVRDLLRQRPELGLGEVHMEMGYRMGSMPHSWLQPDVSITHADQSGDDHYEGAPLVAIEVASVEQQEIAIRSDVLPAVEISLEDIFGLV